MSVAMANLNVDERTGEREGGAIQYVRPEDVSSLDALSSSASVRSSTPTQTTTTGGMAAEDHGSAYPTYESIEYAPPAASSGGKDRSGALGLFKVGSRSSVSLARTKGSSSTGDVPSEAVGGRRRKLSLVGGMGGWRALGSGSADMERQKSDTSSTSATSSDAGRAAGTKKSLFSAPMWKAPSASGRSDASTGRPRKMSLTDPMSWTTRTDGAQSGNDASVGPAPPLPTSPSRSNFSTPRPRPRNDRDRDTDRAHRDEAGYRMSAAHLELQGYHPPTVDRRASVRSSRMQPIVYPQLAPGMSTGVTKKDEERRSKHSQGQSGNGVKYVAASTNLPRRSGHGSGGGISYPSVGPKPSSDPFSRLSIKPPPSDPFHTGSSSSSAASSSTSKPAMSDFARDAESVRVVAETEAAVKALGKFRSEGGKELKGVVCPEELVGAFVALAVEGTERGVETCGLLLGTLVRFTLICSHRIDDTDLDEHAETRLVQDHDVVGAAARSDGGHVQHDARRRGVWVPGVAGPDDARLGPPALIHSIISAPWS